ncbi:hypothetical protein SLS54_009656 [Diplodia seriata]
MEPASISTAATLRKQHQDLLHSGRLVDQNFSSKLSWGRSSARRPWLRSLFAASPVFLAPLASLCCFVTLSQFDGSLSAFLAAGLEDGFLPLFSAYGPRLSFKATMAYASWIILQAILFHVLPGPTNTGQRTPAGHLLKYRTNGLLAWVVTHALYAALCWSGLLDPGFIPRNWSGLFAAMNLSGFLLSAFAYAKAYLAPTHPEDRKFSGSAPYDFYMGIELNPRFGQTFDFKLFTNGRPGMMAWTLIDISNLAHQYQTHHHLPLPLLLVTILQTLYVLDFFINESWYLRTIDIAHDHYGFYLAWGCFCFLPTTYTLQAQYLGSLRPTTPSPSPITLALVFALGLAGYALFRSVNAQKDVARRTSGACRIWGAPAVVIRAPYATADGARHESVLLCSGLSPVRDPKIEVGTCEV